MVLNQKSGIRWTNRSDFGNLELFSFFMCETYYDILQPVFGREAIQLPYAACISFEQSIKLKSWLKNHEGYKMKYIKLITWLEASIIEFSIYKIILVYEIPNRKKR